jgi:hypothetical protein
MVKPEVRTRTLTVSVDPCLFMVPRVILLRINAHPAKDVFGTICGTVLHRSLACHAILFNENDYRRRLVVFCVHSHILVLASPAVKNYS